MGPLDLDNEPRVDCIIYEYNKYITCGEAM
jgi:hypothetical protein